MVVVITYTRKNNGKQAESFYRTVFSEALSPGEELAQAVDHGRESRAVKRNITI